MHGDAQAPPGESAGESYDGSSGGRGWLACGGIGAFDRARLARIAGMLGDPPVLLDSDGAVLRATRGAAWPGGAGASCAAAPLPGGLPADARANAERFDAVSVEITGPGSATVHGGVSGAVPLYVDLEGGGALLCSQVDPLARTRVGPLVPDWDAWAQILAMGGPLQGRTPFAGIRRLGPYARVHAAPAGAGLSGAGATGTGISGDGFAGGGLVGDGWPWLSVQPDARAGVEALREALRAAVAEHGERNRLRPLLSGGWDSRILTALAAGSGAHRQPGAGQPEQSAAGQTAVGETVAWTTSSDTGTVLEELTAAKAAATLGIGHRIAPARWDTFGDDLELFARAGDYQTSFHVWLAPLARALATGGGTVLDGLGGGIFVGGAFADEPAAGQPGGRPLLDSRYERMSRYLGAAHDILHPNVTAQLRARTRAGFDAVAAPLTEHPFGNSLTAYLTRTVPGISLAPFGLLARDSAVATPFLQDTVVRAALSISPEQHEGGALYRRLLEPIAPELAAMPTAAELTPQRRQHPRRVSSVEAAEHIRALCTAEPVRGLLAPGLAEADVEVWRKHLNRTRFQHLVRGLATLSLWLRRYRPILVEDSVDALAEPGA